MGWWGGWDWETGGADGSWAAWRPKGKAEGGVVEALARVRPAEGHHTCHAHHTWIWGALGALTQSTRPGSPLGMGVGGWRAFQQESEPCDCASNCYPRAPPDLWGQNLPRRHWASVRSGQQGMRSTHRSQVSCTHSPPEAVSKASGATLKPVPHAGHRCLAPLLNGPQHVGPQVSSGPQPSPL